MQRLLPKCWISRVDMGWNRLWEERDGWLSLCWWCFSETLACSLCQMYNQKTTTTTTTTTTMVANVDDDAVEDADWMLARYNGNIQVHILYKRNRPRLQQTHIMHTVEDR